MDIQLVIALLLIFEFLNVMLGIPMIFTTKDEKVLKWIIDSVINFTIAFFGGLLMWLIIYVVKFINKAKTRKEDKEKRTNPSLDELIKETMNKILEIYPLNDYKIEYKDGYSCLCLDKCNIKLKEDFQNLIKKHNEIHKTYYSDLISQSERNIGKIVGILLGMEEDTIKATEDELISIMDKCNKLFDKIINEIELRDEKVNELIKEKLKEIKNKIDDDLIGK